MGEELPPDNILHKLLRNGFIGVDLDSSINNSSANEAFFDKKPTGKTPVTAPEGTRQEDGVVYS